MNLILPALASINAALAVYGALAGFSPVTVSLSVLSAVFITLVHVSIDYNGR